MPCTPTKSLPHDTSGTESISAAEYAEFMSFLGWPYDNTCID